MGHLDLEYEWFLRKCEVKTIIENKYCNELGYKPKPIQDETYKKQIIVDLSR